MGKIPKHLTSPCCSYLFCHSVYRRNLERSQRYSAFAITVIPLKQRKGPAEGPFPISQLLKTDLEITPPSCASQQPRTPQQSSYDTRREPRPSPEGEDTGETTSHRFCDELPCPAALLRYHHGKPTVPAPCRREVYSSSGSAPLAP